MKKVTLEILPVLIMLSIFFNACSDAGGNEKEEEDPANFIYVETTKLKSEPFVSYISLIAVAKAYQKAEIAVEEGGIIDKFLKEKGNYVKQNEVILELQNEVLKANLEATKAQFEMAENNFKKQEEVYNQKVTSELQYLNAKYERDAAKANYELIKSRYEKTFVKAPFSGILDKKYLEAGEFAAPGTPIVSLVSLDKIKIEAGVPENYVGDIKTGNKVKVIFNDLGGVTYDEEISYVGSTIDSDNRTFPIEIVIPNKDGKIKPELNAAIKIEKAKFEKTMVIPEEVVIKTDKGNVVFVEENGVAKMSVVNVAGRFSNKAAISNGLEEGDNLITVGYQNLVDGEKVKVLE